MMIDALEQGLYPGDLLPWIRAPMLGGDRDFRIDRLGGNHLLLAVTGPADSSRSEAVLRIATEHRPLFTPRRPLLILSSDLPAPALHATAAGGGIYFLGDQTGELAQRLGVLSRGANTDKVGPLWLVLAPGLRVIGRYPPTDGGSAVAMLRAASGRPAPLMNAPALAIPNVIEPDFCRALIDLYERHGGTESGFMREVDGQTVGMHDHSKKRRQDHTIGDEAVRAALRQRLSRRVVPMIKRAFNFEVTRVERYIVARYDGQEGGHFAAHRDNTTPGTAHRRFAVTINLNGDYEGGDLSFPEFGERTYRADPGGAIVFSCSLLHEARRVTAGTRYATLPFLYDDAAARIREANHGTLAEASGSYRAEREDPTPPFTARGR
jgi:predicted 2-oxoglutarate/Fe(II)-dependent dioxygenase YbiX